MSEYPSTFQPQRSFMTTPQFTVPSYPGRASAGRSQPNSKKETYLKFTECIFSFEKNLDVDHEIGARLLSFATEVTFYIEDVCYLDTDMISFSGISENGENLQLVQHVSQLNVLFVAMKKRRESPVRIGYKLQRAAEEGSWNAL